MSETMFLKDICSLITKGTTPTTAGGGFAAAGINFIKSESLSYDGLIDEKKFAYIDKETHEKLKRSQISDGDILYSIAGVNLGKCGIVRTHMLPANTNQAVAIIRVNQTLASPFFVSFFLRNTRFVEGVLNGVAQSAQPNVNLGDIGMFKIPCWSLDRQQAIASLLGALDDKIELNRRMNETLEATARLFFKDWFVDFGPTRAKSEGRPAYLAPELWALFPDALDDDDKPMGWTEGTLADISQLNPDVWGSKNAPASIEYVDLANTKWGEIEQTQLFSWEKAPSRARRILCPGDTIIGTVRPGNGSFALVGSSGLTGSTGFAVLRPKYQECREALYIAATSPQAIETLSHLADGAAYPAVRPEVVTSQPIIVPDKNCLKTFSAQTAPLIDLVLANRQESRSLFQTRDLLLPKLMSGEIRLRDAEKLLEQVA